FSHPRMAGSRETYSTRTVNSPSAGCGTGALVTSHVESSGRPTGRRASRTCLFTDAIRLPFDCRKALLRCGDSDVRRSSRSVEFDAGFNYTRWVTGITPSPPDAPRTEGRLNASPS